jgi:hypothetical protein
MSYIKGISRTLLDEFNNIQDTHSPKQTSKKMIKKEDSDSEEEENPNVTPKRDYETRNRNRTQGSANTRQQSSKQVLKPRQENSLGELTKKFIQLIKQTEDYCIDLNDAVAELNVQK